MSENAIVLFGFKIGLFSGPPALKPLPAALKPLYPFSTLRVERTLGVLSETASLVVADSSLRSVTSALGATTSSVSLEAGFVSTLGCSCFSTGFTVLVTAETSSFSGFTSTLGSPWLSVTLGVTTSLFLFSVVTALLFFSFSTTVVIAFSHVLAVVLLPLSVATAWAAVWDEPVSAAWASAPPKKKRPDSIATLAAPTLYLRIPYRLNFSAVFSSIFQLFFEIFFI